MTCKEKLVWLRKIFSNSPQARAEVMSAEIPQPLFESQKDFAAALEELEYESETLGSRGRVTTNGKDNCPS